MGTKFPSVPGSESSFSLRQTDFWNDSQLSPSLFRMVSAEFMIISTIKHNSHNEDIGKHNLDFTAFKYPSGTQLWRKPSLKTPGEGNGCVLSIGWVTQPARVKNPYNQLCPKSHRLQQQRLVAGRCPTSVLGHGNQWLLPTRVSGGHQPPLLKGLHYF